MPRRTPEQSAETYRRTYETGFTGRGIIGDIFDFRSEEERKEDEEIEKAALIDRIRDGKDKE